MKTKILILIIILTVAHLYAQEKGQDVFAPDYHTHDIIDQSIAGDEYGLQIDQSNYNSSVLGACRLDTIYDYTYENVTLKVPKYRNIFSYNAFNEIESGYSDKYVTGAWQPLSKNTITYDAQNRRNEYLGYEWVNNAWVNKYKFNYFYDNLTYVTIFQVWKSNAWVNYNKTTIIKNNLPQNISNKSEQWTNNEWVASWFDTYGYNNDNLLETITHQINSNGVLVNKYNTKIYYDMDKKLILEERFAWENNGYKLTLQKHYYYNQELEEYNITSVASGSDLVLDGKEMHTYDTNSRLTSTYGYKWENQNWVLVLRYTKEYNTNDDIIANDNYTMWSPMENNFLMHTRREHKCTLLSSSADLSLTSTFNIYPNPFYGDHFTIYSDLPQRYKVYDLAGKMVGQGDLNTGENEIYIPMLSQGMYILKSREH
ncbi:MAG: T9SS type A sorting domain-containing protein [Saprospiraceae bacterium]|nr:T9SS type A sorting domain-containing protein [Saprospiraceae bacterium]